MRHGRAVLLRYDSVLNASSGDEAWATHAPWLGKRRHRCHAKVMAPRGEPSLRVIDHELVQLRDAVYVDGRFHVRADKHSMAALATIMARQQGRDALAAGQCWPGAGAPEKRQKAAIQDAEHKTKQGSVLRQSGTDESEHTKGT